MQLNYFLIAITIVSIMIIGQNTDVFAEIQNYTTHTLSIDGRPTSAVVNENANVIYVTDFFAGKMTEIDGFNDKILGHINVTKTSFGVGFNPETNLIYVGGEFTNIVKVINAGTKEIEKTIPMASPYDIAINSQTNMIYVTSDRTNAVFLIDGNSNEIVSKLNVNKPCGIAVNEETGTVYVTSEIDNAVHVFEKNKLVKIIPVESSPRGVAVNEETNTIYVTNQETNTVSVIDGVTNTVIDRISVGEIPRRIAIQSDTNQIYVTNHGSNEISVINGKTNLVTKTIPVKSPFEIVINQNTNKLYSMYLGNQGISVIEKTDSNENKLNFETTSEKIENKNTIEKPLKQFLSGVHPLEIKCKENFDLIFKIVSLQPACVKPTTAQKLGEYGWTIGSVVLK